jgi:hypothetical protein
MRTPGTTSARATVAVIAVLSASACLPYNMASTAQPVPVGERKVTTTIWFMPNGVSSYDTTKSGHTIRGFDGEVRWGVDEDADVGLRVPAGGLVLNYKRRVAGFAHPDSAAVAWQLGGGFVNAGEHGFGEFSLLASGPKRGGAVVYGGARVMGVTPLSSGAVHDDPSYGGFFGARISVGKEVITPELAIYHDRSALNLRKSEVIFVPSVSIPADLFRLVRGLGGIGLLGR